MAKPKGGTLSALFEVSEQERQAFYERIQRKIHPIDAGNAPPTSGIHEQGTPQQGIPESGTPAITAPDSGIPIANKIRPLASTPPLPQAETHESGRQFIGIPDTGIPLLGIPPSGTLANRLRIRRALQVQDGHSLGEHLILTTLWNEADPVEGQAYRRITIGYRTLSAICRLTVNNCKANLKSLTAKMAIDAESGYSSTAATTYRVYSFSEILRRREAAGLTHVLRSRGSVFVNPETGIPVSGIQPVVGTGIPDSEKGTPELGERGIPASGTQLRIKKEAQKEESDPSSVLAIISQAIRQYITIDDDGVRRIIAGCRQKDPKCAIDEIAHFGGVSAEKIARQRNVDNPAGLLINQVPRFFPGNELDSYRVRNAQNLAKGRETARKILDDPEASQQERDWATSVISVEQPAT